MNIDHTMHAEKMDASGKVSIQLDVKGGESAIMFDKDGRAAKVWTAGGDITPASIACYCALYSTSNPVFADKFMEHLTKEKEGKDAGQPIINPSMRSIVDMLDAQINQQPASDDQQEVAE